VAAAAAAAGAAGANQYRGDQLELDALAPAIAGLQRAMYEFDQTFGLDKDKFAATSTSSTRHLASIRRR
jgi:hypothetical protein